MDLAEIISKAKAAGVVGAGGAGFPTWRKLDCAGRVDTLVLNGAECEPLLYADYYCLLCYGEKILETALELKTALGLSRVILAVKKKRREVVEHLSAILSRYEPARLLLLPDVYPSGDEHILVYSATGRVVPQGGIPLDAGVLVQNVQTMVHLHDAFRANPVTRRFVTISGAVSRPLTAEAPIGTPLEALLGLAGGVTCPRPRYLAGGAMMGELVDRDFAIQKTTSGILVLPEENPAVQERLRSLDRESLVSKSVCDQCYTCTELCPRHLLGHAIEPHLLMRRAGEVLENPAERDHIALYCCECGICSLIACPVRITPRRLIAGMKKKMGPGFKRQQDRYEPHRDYHRKTLPMSYVLTRLALNSYDRPNRFVGALEGLARVVIATREFGGGLAAATVAPGQRVVPGELVARGRYTDFHASLYGEVAAVNGRIEIRGA